MTILRVYDPSGCDENGVPLGWERCQTCDGTGRIDMASFGKIECQFCDGFGSLKAAALDFFEDNHRHEFCDCSEDAPHRLRCEDCGHPMSEGTWEPGSLARSDMADVMRWLAEGGQPGKAYDTHYSSCDEGCRHGGPVRVDQGTGWQVARAPESGQLLAPVDVAYPAEASWRSVDVRTMGWQHDLRPEKLAVLCLRCFADRGNNKKED